jgi:hypothetical protein
MRSPSASRAFYFEARPQLEQRWKGARQKCTEDNRYHLDYLCEALSFGQPALFTEYTVWAAALLAGLNIPGEALAFNLNLLRTTLASELGGAGGALASQYLDAALNEDRGRCARASQPYRGNRAARRSGARVFGGPSAG